MKVTLEQQRISSEFYQHVIEKSWEDESFKKEFIATPIKALENLYGKNLDFPTGTEIVVEDQSNTDIVYLNIPRKVETEDLELTDEQLEQVAGGDFVIVPGAIIAGIATVALVVAAVAYFKK